MAQPCVCSALQVLTHLPIAQQPVRTAAQAGMLLVLGSANAQPVALVAIMQPTAQSRARTAVLAGMPLHQGSAYALLAVLERTLLLCRHQAALTALL